MHDVFDAETGIKQLRLEFWIHYLANCRDKITLQDITGTYSAQMLITSS